MNKALLRIPKTSKGEDMSNQQFECVSVRPDGTKTKQVLNWQQTIKWQNDHKRFNPEFALFVDNECKAVGYLNFRRAMDMVRREGTRP